MKVTKGAKDKFIELYELGYTIREISSTTGYSFGSVQKALKKAQTPLNKKDNEPKLNRDAHQARKRIETKTELINGTMVTTSNMLLEINNLESKTPYDIMVLHGFDPLAWEPVAVSNKAWGGTSKEQGSYTMYSSSVKVKPIEMQIDTDCITELFDMLEPKKWEVKEIENNSKLFATVEMFDIHAGKLAWDEETGSNYDLKIAKEMMTRIIDQNVVFLKTVNPSEIIFPLGNDLFQCDNDNNTTTHGTPQDVDTRHKKLFREIGKLMFECIGKLSTVAKVRTLLIPGNHDEATAFYLTEVLEQAFMDNPNVVIETGVKTRKYVRKGKVLIGYAHGKDETKKELDGLMQKEAYVDWGLSEYRELHLGHIHIERVEEKNGMKIRYVPSISGTDKWHYGNGYTETDRVSQTFVYDEDNGLQTIRYFR